MNSFKLLVTLAVLVASCNCEADPDPILGAHVALPHNLPHDPIGVQRVPVAPIHHIPSITLKHHGSPVAIGHSAGIAPLAFAHHATVAPLAVSHHAATHVAAPISVVKHVPSRVAVSHSVPVAVAHHAPAVAVSHAAPVAHVNAYDYNTPVKSQYHSQNELGQYSYGYNAGNSAKHESRDAYGNVRGSYSYVDSYGNVQTKHYVADDYGFRVSGTDLPVGPVAHRYKRSYVGYPASTGPLTTVSHVSHAAPVVHKVSHVAPSVHRVSHVAPSVHRVSHVAPAVHRVSHVAPAVHRVSHVAPAVHRVSHVAPAVHNVGPLVHSAPLGLGYAGLPHYGYSSYLNRPSVTTYRNYDTPAITYGDSY